MRFGEQRISHTVTVMVLYLTFYTEELDSMGDVINIFTFSGTVSFGWVGISPADATLGRNIG